MQMLKTFIFCGEQLNLKKINGLQAGLRVIYGMISTTCTALDEFIQDAVQTRRVVNFNER